MRRIPHLIASSAGRLVAFVFWSIVTAAASEAAVSATTITSIFAPESTPAKSAVDLAMFVLTITAIIFVVVASLLVYSIVKFRDKPANDRHEPPQVYGSTQIEAAWTIVPMLIVVVLFL